MKCLFTLDQTWYLAKLMVLWLLFQKKLFPKKCLVLFLSILALLFVLFFYTNIVSLFNNINKKAGIISLLDEEEPQLKVNGVLMGNLVGSNVRNININQRLFRFAPEGVV